MYGRRQAIAIWCIAGDEAGNVWMGSTRGFHTIRPDLSVSTLTGTNGLSNDDVRSICKSPDGSLWVGTSYGLNLVRGNQVVTNWAAADGHPIEIVVSLLAEPDGTVWIGTLDRGLFRYRDGRFSHYSATEGLPDSSVYQMIDDGLGSFWFSCGRGVFSVPKAELHAVADHRATRFHANLYNRADGLRSLELTSSVQPAGMRTRDGRLWFPSNRGVALIDPGNLPRNLVAPRPRIERAVLSGIGTNLVVRVQDLPETGWTVPAPERIDRSPDIRGTLPRIEIREPGAALELPPGGDSLEQELLVIKNRADLALLDSSNAQAADQLRSERPGIDRLTPAERRILRLIADDKTSKEIASLLGVSPNTVDNHRANICEKLGLRGTHSLLKFAFDNKSKLNTE